MDSSARCMIMRWHRGLWKGSLPLEPTFTMTNYCQTHPYIQTMYQIAGHHQNRILLWSWTNYQYTYKGSTSLQTLKTHHWDGHEVNRGRNIDQVVAFPYPFRRFFNASTVPILTKQSTTWRGVLRYTSRAHYVLHDYVARHLHTVETWLSKN